MLRSARIATLLAAAGLATGLASAQTATQGDSLDADTRPTQSVIPVAAPGNAFTYQGFLQESGAPVTTPVDVRFTLYNDAAGTSTVGGPITIPNITPDDGVFSTSLDFGVAPFEANEALWLRVEVSEAGMGAYDDLGLQPLRATPFALNTRGITVDASGNVGVGVAAPEERLDVAGFVQVDGGVQHDNAQHNFLKFFGNNDTQLSAGAFLRLQTGSSDRALITSGSFRIHNDLIADADVGIGTTSPSAPLTVRGPSSWPVQIEGPQNPGINIAADGAGSSWAIYHDDSTDNLTFRDSTSGANRMIIRGDNGKVGIGTETPDFPLTLRGDSPTNNALGLIPLAGGSGYHFNFGGGSLQFWETGDKRRVTFLDDDRISIGNGFGFSNVGVNIDLPFDFGLNLQQGDAGKPGGGSWTNTSDRRLKKNITKIEGALDTLLALEGVHYEYKDPDAIGELHGVRTGFIAQDAEEVIPDWVWEAGDGYKRMTIRGFEAMAVEAMRELKRDNDDLSARVASLEERLDAASNTPVFRSSLTLPALGALALGGFVIARRRAATA